MGEIRNFAPKINTEQAGEKDLGLEVEKPKRGPREVGNVDFSHMTPTELAEMKHLIHLIDLKRKLSQKFKNPRPEPQAKKMEIMRENARLQKQFKEKYGLNFSDADRIMKEQEQQKREKKAEELKIRQAKKAIQDADIIQGELVNDTPPPLPQQREESTIIPPADMNLARFSAQTESSQPPQTLFGKFKSWLSGESAYRKFGQMQADTDETPADRRAAAKGQAMMEKQDKRSFKEEMRKAQEEIEDEQILAKEGPKWSKQAEEDMKKPVTTDEEIEKMFTPNALNKKLTEMEDRRTEEKSDLLYAKSNALSRRDYAKTMQAGAHLAEAEKLETEGEEEVRPGQYAEKGRINMEKFSMLKTQIEDRLEELKPVVKSIKLGWFTHLKIDKNGFITNLPGGQIDMTIEHLAKEKEKLGAKGKIKEANEIVDQMKALEEYSDKLVQLEKLMAEAGQI